MERISEGKELDWNKNEQYRVAKKRAELNVTEMAKILNRIDDSIIPDDSPIVSQVAEIIDQWRYLQTLSPQHTSISALIENYDMVSKQAMKMIDKMNITKKANDKVNEIFNRIKAQHQQQDVDSIDNSGKSR